MKSMTLHELPMSGSQGGRAGGAPQWVAAVLVTAIFFTWQIQQSLIIRAERLRSLRSTMTLSITWRAPTT